MKRGEAMDNIRRVSVKIQGKEYNVMCIEDEEYIQRIAYFVDRKINQVSTANPRLSTAMAAVLTALNIADEMFKNNEQIEQLKRELAQKNFELQKYHEGKNKKEELPKVEAIGLLQPNLRNEILVSLAVSY